ncbi:hypothetical protein [Longimicrobium terrae]|uniref:Uncharacterized protein n=1 Tax=Longimicrobium terrae TaxID=1639882 RepID=A0A841GUC9_9BACT|nr:hypothetical protein [Longimicrobium terrae]MBB4635953.1 hypothetical protein [Longimicrobium terrae]MBB6070349.1 hypothetical protein [Longimicrobium terrae]NNC30846.1 hypothetical protein [Longimicrobium terrae]
MLTGGGRLPPASALPPRVSIGGSATESELAQLAAPLVRAGILGPDDWRRSEATPKGLLLRGWQRWVRRLTGTSPDALDLHLILAPWAQVLGQEPEERTAASRARLAITVDAGSCIVAPLEAMAGQWGPRAAGVIAYALRHGLGRAVHVWDPSDLDWMPIWWAECLDCSDEEDAAAERAATRRRIREFAAVDRHVQRSYTPLATRADRITALGSLPGAIRRSAAALVAESGVPRRHTSGGARDEMRSGFEGHSSAAVLLTRRAHDVVHHAYDELQEDEMNSGYSGAPHAVVLIDTRSPAHLAASLREARRVLRTLVRGEQLMDAVRGIAG